MDPSIDRTSKYALFLVPVVAFVASLPSCSAARFDASRSETAAFTRPSTDANGSTDSFAGRGVVTSSKSLAPDPQLVGLTVEDATRRCNWAGVDLKIHVAPNPRWPTLQELLAVVTAQDPVVMDPVNGDWIAVTVGAANDVRTTIPDLRSDWMATAVARCAARGLRLRVWDQGQLRRPRPADLAYVVEAIAYPPAAEPKDPIDVGAIVGVVIVIPHPLDPVLIALLNAILKQEHHDDHR